ncbi:bifunctional copper resistance protein CopD/cytochrome c oxidase assembly protein [Nocardioides sp. Y6]|uniref:Bifunctional copper resistance protein CopD/cytochrome c oxidase assembly protein n=1 Tax=Nocardioides malaquae TaxID=2773426 RepID=A0ABR9RXK6_9ACTN|nr:cytochrome c oxidase assembly protein [Nocardioides malaquae]MBE7325890.1 bifunctional copper resistance protein CopD/cytochrome c oxidase assembly protein [Nocardioides malaquae]
MTRERLWVLSAAALAGVGAMAAVLVLAGGLAEPVAGLPDAGALTAWALPAAVLLGDVAAVVAVGSLVAPLLTALKLRDELPEVASRAAAVARWAAAVWGLSVVATAWLTTSDILAVPATRVGPGELSTFLTDFDQGLALTWQAGLVLLLLVWTSWVTTAWRAALGLVLALAAVVPPLLTGHSASAGSHSTAVVAIGFHVLAAVVWAGGVLALWWHLRRDPEARLRAARRFSSLAAWCFAVTGLSGVLSAWVRLDGLTDFVTSGYGRATLAKVVVLGVVGLLAVRLRRLVRDRMTGPSVWRSFSALTALELVAMAAATGLGVALSRTPPPVGQPYTTKAESLIGNPMPPEPSLAGMLTTWQLSGFGLAVVGLGLAGYLVGLRTLRRRGDRWPVGRTVAWFAGMAVIAFATMGGLGVWSHVMFSVHMTSHMALSMLAPVLLVLGSPITLALRALPGADVKGGDGPRQLLLAFLSSRWSRVVTNPAFATVMFVGSLYAIYFSSLFDWLMSIHLGHTLMELHFLLAGFLYYEVIIGTSPLPRRVPHLGRLGLLVLAAPFHAFFAISVMSTTTLIGEEYYTLIDRPYATDLLADQSLAGGLTWALGEVPLLLVAIVLLFQWFRSDTRAARQRDRQADRDNDAELEAYNAMLQRIADNRAQRSDRDPATRGRSEQPAEQRDDSSPDG